MNNGSSPLLFFPPVRFSTTNPHSTLGHSGEEKKARSKLSRRPPDSWADVNSRVAGEKRSGGFKASLLGSFASGLRGSREGALRARAGIDARFAGQQPGGGGGSSLWVVQWVARSRSQLGPDMSYCRQEGKDRIIFVTKEDHETPSNAELVADDPNDPYEDHGLILPNGDINWNCPCLGGMASGPCGEQFKSAFSCFHYSKEEIKGSDCVDQFRAMQECMQKYPDLYPQENDDEDEEEDEEDNQSKDLETTPSVGKEKDGSS